MPLPLITCPGSSMSRFARVRHVPLSSGLFSGFTLVAWNQLCCEYLHHGNWQTLQRRALGLLFLEKILISTPLPCLPATPSLPVSWPCQPPRTHGPLPSKLLHLQAPSRDRSCPPGQTPLCPVYIPLACPRQHAWSPNFPDHTYPKTRSGHHSVPR